MEAYLNSHLYSTCGSWINFFFKNIFPLLFYCFYIYLHVYMLFVPPPPHTPPWINFWRSLLALKKCHVLQPDGSLVPSYLLAVWLLTWQLTSLGHKVFSVWKRMQTLWGSFESLRARCEKMLSAMKMLLDGLNSQCPLLTLPLSAVNMCRAVSLTDGRMRQGSSHLWGGLKTPGLPS
jgi:hypothetical protein